MQECNTKGLHKGMSACLRLGFKGLLALCRGRKGGGVGVPLGQGMSQVLCRLLQSS
jgi:hypothetical protein